MKLNKTARLLLILGGGAVAYWYFVVRSRKAAAAAAAAAERRMMMADGAYQGRSQWKPQSLPESLRAELSKWLAEKG